MRSKCMNISNINSQWVNDEGEFCESITLLFVSEPIYHRKFRISLTDRKFVAEKTKTTIKNNQRLINASIRQPSSVSVF